MFVYTSSVYIACCTYYIHTKILTTTFQSVVYNQQRCINITLRVCSTISDPHTSKRQRHHQSHTDASIPTAHSKHEDNRVKIGQSSFPFILTRTQPFPNLYIHTVYVTEYNTHTHTDIHTHQHGYTEASLDEGCIFVGF